MDYNYLKILTSPYPHVATVCARKWWEDSSKGFEQSIVCTLHILGAEKNSWQPCFSFSPVLRPYLFHYSFILPLKSFFTYSLPWRFIIIIIIIIIRSSLLDIPWHAPSTFLCLPLQLVVLQVCILKVYSMVYLSI